MAGRVDISSKSANQAQPSRGGGGNMTQTDKIKLGVAIAILVAGGGWICYYMGFFDSFLQGKADANIPIVDGKPVAPENVQEFRENERKYKEANEENKKEHGDPVGS